jgi:hypothetical protein
MREQAGDATITHSIRQGYDQGLNDMGLAYRPPVTPDHESRMAKKIDQLFKGKKQDSKFKKWIKEKHPEFFEKD